MYILSEMCLFLRIQKKKKFTAPKLFFFFKVALILLNKVK